MKSCLIITFALLQGFSSGEVLANALHRVELLSDQHSDRIVFEFDHRADYKMVSTAPDVVEIAFSDAEFSPEFLPPSLPPDLTVISNMAPHIDPKGRLVVTIHLQREAEPTGITLCANPWKYAMDLAPKLTNGDDRKPRYIPGDRPIPTKYSEAGSGSSDSEDYLRLSHFSFIVYMLLALSAGAITTLALRRKREPVRGIPSAPPRPSVVVPPEPEALHQELERDLCRLKRTVEQERTEPWRALSLVEERQQLILKLMREGRNLDAIARALDLPPDDLRQMLDRHP